MQRREFISLTGGAAATWPLAAHAQQPARRVYRVGFLSSVSRERLPLFTGALEDGLRNLGYRVGENVVIDYRFDDGNTGRLSEIAADLVRLGVDVIATSFNPVTVAAMKATSAIPIVMITSVDPVSTGLVASLARPGGNVTGLAVDTSGEIADMALAKRLPTASVQRELAEAGFLLTYGADIRELYRRSATFLDKIFKGAKPADLPVEQPTKLELLVNLKTAKALGIIVPPSVLARTDEVIE